MDKYLAENLEAYLAGQLGDQGRREFEDRLARNPNDREMIGQMAGISGLFDSFELPPDTGLGPSPGFHRQVLRTIELQRRAPVLGPFFPSASKAAAEPQVKNIAQSVLAEPPESADYCNVRLGCDIDLNRSTMLAVVMYTGGGGR